MSTVIEYQAPAPATYIRCRNSLWSARACPSLIPPDSSLSPAVTDTVPDQSSATMLTSTWAHSQPSGACRTTTSTSESTSFDWDGAHGTLAMYRCYGPRRYGGMLRQPPKASACTRVAFTHD